MHGGSPVSVWEDMGPWGYCARCNFLLLLKPNGDLPQHRRSIGGLCLRFAFDDAEEGMPDPPYDMPPNIDTHDEKNCRKCKDIRQAQRTSAQRRKVPEDGS